MYSQVRAAREEGSLRIRTLEEGVARLGARGGEAATALAAATTEAEAAVRREARLRSELALAQQAARRANGQAAELRCATEGRNESIPTNTGEVPSMCLGRLLAFTGVVLERE